MASVLTERTGDRPFSVASPDWVIFRCGDRRFAAAIHCVRRILSPRPTTRVPGCGPWLHGLVSFRGQVITVLDFGQLAGLGPAALVPDHRVLLTEHRERICGFTGESVEAVARATEYVSREASGELPDLPLRPEEVAGMGRWSGE